MKDGLKITRRNEGISLAPMISQTNAFMTWWVTYYRHTQSWAVLREIDGWLRRKLRCVRIKQCKRAMTIAAFLQDCGVSKGRAWSSATPGRGWWRMSQTPAVQEAMPTAWFDRAGLVGRFPRYNA